MKEMTSYFLLLLSILTTVLSSHISIDLGSEFYKVSIVKSKGFEMVENLNSKTKTPTVLFFKDNQRLFEAEALSKKGKYPKDTFSYMTNFLGETYASPFLNTYLDQYYLEYNREENNQTSMTQFDIQYHHKAIKLPIEGIFSMLLRHIQSMVENFSNEEVKDCLMTIPSFFNYKQRLALAQSAKIANVPLVGFVSNNIAAAVHYSLKQTFDKPSYYIYYNMGASFTQVLLVSHQKTSMNTQEISVIGEAYDRTLGGNRFTRNLVVEIIERFNKKNNLNVNRMKVYHKILPQAKKYQDILSANKEAQISILNIAQGLNFNDRITRKEFETINNDTFRLIYKPINQVLRLSNMNITQISQIELIGGGIRVPFVQKELKRRLGNYSSIIGTHLNGDDSMALGAAYILSNITKTLKSRRITLLNGNGPSSILTAVITNQNQTEETYCAMNNISSSDAYVNESLNNSCIHYINQTEVIVPLRSGYGLKRVLKYKHDTDLSIDIKETIEQGNATTPIMQFNISGVKTEIELIKSLTHNDSVNVPLIHLTFIFDDLGELALSSYALFDVHYYYTNTTEIDSNAFQSTTQYDYVPDYINELPKEDKANITQILNQSSEFNLSESDVTQLKNRLKIGTSRKQITKKSLIVTNRHYFPMGLDNITISNLTNKLNAIDKYEENKTLTIEQKNRLETIIYTKRSWVESNDSKHFGTIDEHEEALRVLYDINQWFEDEGEDASYSDLDIKIQNLTKAFAEFDRRIKVNSDRVIAIEKFEVNKKNLMIKARKMVVEYPWIREYFEVNFTEYLNDMEQFLEQNSKRQNKRKLYEEPVLVAKMIMDNITQINSEYEKMTIIEKPRHPALPLNKRISSFYKENNMN